MRNKWPQMTSFVGIFASFCLFSKHKAHLINVRETHRDHPPSRRWPTSFLWTDRLAGARWQAGSRWCWRWCGAGVPDWDESERAECCLSVLPLLHPRPHPLAIPILRLIQAICLAALATTDHYVVTPMLPGRHHRRIQAPDTVPPSHRYRGQRGTPKHRTVGHSKAPRMRNMLLTKHSHNPCS